MYLPPTLLSIPLREACCILFRILLPKALTLRDGWPASVMVCSLACVPSHLLPELQQRHRLVQLPCTLNRHDVGALIAHRDVLFDQAFPEILRRFFGELRQAPALSHPSLIWLV